MSFTLRRRKGHKYWEARIVPPEGRRYRWDKNTHCERKSDARVVAERWDKEASLSRHRVDLAEALSLLRQKKKRAKRRPGTLERFDLACAFLLGYFGEDRNITTIELEDTGNYIDHRRRPRQTTRLGRPVTVPGVADRTIAIELGHLVSALQRCAELKRYTGIPKAVWPPELSKKSGTRKHRLSYQQYQELLPGVGPTTGYFRAQRFGAGVHGGGEHRRQWIQHDKPMGNDWREHLTTYVYTGMRAGELYLVEASDVGEITIHIRGYKTAHATTAGDRHVPIHDDLRPILDRRCRAHPTGPLFPLTSPSLKSQERAFWRVLEKASRRAGIPQTNENDLRRTFASWCKDAKVAEWTVVEWMGHTSSKMVREVYAHGSEEAGAEEMAKLPSKSSPHIAPTRRKNGVVRGQSGKEKGNDFRKDH